MTTKPDDPVKPAAQAEHAGRLATPPARSDGIAGLWAEVDAEVQRQLGPLEAEIRGKVAGVRVAAGHTHGPRFLLFSYRTFSIPGSAVDPIVAGLTFLPAEQGVIVEADVSGEATGDCIASIPTKTVASAREALLAASRESAGKLCQSAPTIVTALTNPSRQVE